MFLTNDMLWYLGGLFDGEGCVNSYWVNRKRHTPTPRVTVSMCMTNPDVILFMKNTFGGSFCPVVRKLSTKPAYHWCISDATAYKFLLKMRPYVIIKAKEFDVAIKLQERVRMTHRELNDGKRGRRLSEEEIRIRTELHNELKALKRIAQPLGTLTIGANSGDCCDANPELNGLQPNPKCVTTIYPIRKERDSLDLQENGTVRLTLS